jgi:hypothetical protein
VGWTRCKRKDMCRRHAWRGRRAAVWKSKVGRSTIHRVSKLAAGEFCHLRSVCPPLRKAFRRCLRGAERATGQEGKRKERSEEKGKISLHVLPPEASGKRRLQTHCFSHFGRRHGDAAFGRQRGDPVERLLLSMHAEVERAVMDWHQPRCAQVETNTVPSTTPAIFAMRAVGALKPSSANKRAAACRIVWRLSSLRGRDISRGRQPI